jgi:RNAse (barnase) inhibitor barstar
MVYEIDGSRFDTLDEFFDEVSRTLIPNAEWERNLDAFHDILRGGFGTPSGGFTVVWKDSARSRAQLGHRETSRQLRRRLSTCHPSAWPRVAWQLMAATLGFGPTVFDWLVDIIEEHGPGASEAEDRIRLVLE